MQLNTTLKLLISVRQAENRDILPKVETRCVVSIYPTYMVLFVTGSGELIRKIIFTQKDIIDLQARVVSQENRSTFGHEQHFYNIR